MKGRLTLQQRLILPIVLLGLVTLLSNILAVFSINNVNANAGVIVDEYMASEARLEEIRRDQLPKKTRYLGSVLAASSFTLFFGGGLQDGGAAAVFALLICLMQDYVAVICMNVMIFNVVVSFFIGTGISIASHMIPCLHMDMIMIGDIMLLIPGIAITNAVRDVLIGDTISGIMRFIEAMLWAGCLAFGFMSAIWMVGKLW